MNTQPLWLAALFATISVASCSSSSSSDTPVTGTSKSTTHHDASTSSSGSTAGGDDDGSRSGAELGDATVEDDAPSEAGGADDSGPLDQSCPINVSTQTTFMNLAAPVLSALDKTHSDPLIGDAGGAPPAGWNFYQIDGTMCRDGSPNGIYVRYTNSDKLMIYLEGGGACLSPHFCDHNPNNINQMFSGGAQLQGEAFNAILTDNLLSPPIAQQPWASGIFDFTNAANPFNGWNQVYIPYCTGDVHFGSLDQGTVPASVNNGDHFVGYSNMQKFIGHIVPTFPNVSRVILTGSSAGGLGAALNLGMVQDTFTTKIPVDVLDDSGAGFPDLQYMPACFQKQLRDTFGWDNGSIPSDCTDCNQPDGSGLMNLIKYWHLKYHRAKIGLVMSIHDQIFRLFFASSANNCATSDPNLLTTLGLQGSSVPGYTADQWEAALISLRTTYGCTNALSTYYIGSSDSAASDLDGSIDTLHMHIFRDRFYQQLAGSMTIADWVTDLLAGKIEDVGP